MKLAPLETPQQYANRVHLIPGSDLDPLKAWVDYYVWRFMVALTVLTGVPVSFILFLHFVVGV